MRSRSEDRFQCPPMLESCVAGLVVLMLLVAMVGMVGQAHGAGLVTDRHQGGEHIGQSPIQPYKKLALWGHCCQGLLPSILPYSLPLKYFPSHLCHHWPISMYVLCPGVFAKRHYAQNINWDWQQAMTFLDSEDFKPLGDHKMVHASKGVKTAYHGQSPTFFSMVHHIYSPVLIAHKWETFELSAIESLFGIKMYTSPWGLG